MLGTRLWRKPVRTTYRSISAMAVDVGDVCGPRHSCCRSPYSSHRSTAASPERRQVIPSSERRIGGLRSVRAAYRIPSPHLTAPFCSRCPTQRSPAPPAAPTGLASALPWSSPLRIHGQSGTHLTGWTSGQTARRLHHRG